MYALICEIVPLGFVLWALWSLRQVFANYARGEVFTAEPLRHLNNVALALFWGVVAGFVMQAPISFLLNYYHGPGHREVSARLRLGRRGAPLRRRRGARHRARHGGSAPRRRRECGVRLMAIVVNLDVMLAPPQNALGKRLG